MFRINKKLLLVIAACLLITSTTVIAQTWVSTNGPQLATNVFDVTTGNNNIIYAVDNNYLLKSTNGGTSWRATVSGSIVTLCKSDNSNIVMASGLNFFKYSIDGGTNWLDFTGALTTNLTPFRLSASPVNISNMFLGRKFDASTRSVWRSDQSGATWSPCNNFTWSTDIYDLAPYPVNDVNNPSRNAWLWVCGSDPNGLPPAGGEITEAFEIEASTRGVWFSPNAGTDWIPYKMGGLNLRSIAVNHQPSSTPHVYITDGATVYKSTDAGDNFTALDFSDASNIHVIRINNNNNYIFLGTENGIYRSTDGGTAWMHTLQGLESLEEIRSITIEQTTNIVYAGSTLGIYKSTDNGGNWVKVSRMRTHSVASGFPASSILTVSNDNSYVGMFDSYSWANKYLGNAGANFSSNQIYRDPQMANGAHIAGSLDGLPKIYSTTDMGENFYAGTVPSITNGKFNGTVRKLNTSDLYLYGGADVDGSIWKNLFKSNNNGVNWSSVSFTVGGDDLYINDFAPVVGQTLIAALSDGRIMRSIDDGQTWPDASSVGTAANSLTWNQAYTNVIYAVGSGGLYRSTNTGGSYNRNIQGDFKKIIMNPGYPNSSDYVLVLSTDRTKIYSSSNGGYTLTQVQSSLPTPINDITSVAGTNPVLYAATETGVYKVIKPDPTVLSSPANQATNLNPVNLVLSWQSRTGATSYHLIVDDNSDFSSPIINNPNITQTSFQQTFYYSTTYYWKVATANFLGEASYTSVNQFTTMPQPPAISLTWTPSTSDGGFCSPKVSYCKVKLIWTPIAGVTGPYNIYRYICSYSAGDCGSTPFLVAANYTSLSYVDNSVTVLRPGETPVTRYYYYITGSGVTSNKVSVNSTNIWKINDDEKSIPEITMMNENYPNPFNPLTVIKYQLSADDHVTLKVYNVLGEEVATLIDEYQTAGYKSVQFNAASLSSGVYFYRMTGSTFTDLKKMVLVR
ncbi:MAG: T9SS type A sorting domain-containing protein [Ignavibacteriales bacterium]|nr:T9SS type A sorting domain-containing protein [Ignavibacteriales bacterium]